ncbi:MAG: hypothetical protein ACRC35_03125 [Angustibacter sp.]
MTATARVQINPNLRVDRECTIADLDEDVTGTVQVADEVDVYEPVSGLAGHGRVEQIDVQEREVKLWVAWSTLRVSATRAASMVSRNSAVPYSVSSTDRRLITT